MAYPAAVRRNRVCHPSDMTEQTAPYMSVVAGGIPTHVRSSKRHDGRGHYTAVQLGQLTLYFYNIQELKAWEQIIAEALTYHYRVESEM